MFYAVVIKCKKNVLAFFGTVFLKDSIIFFFKRTGKSQYFYKNKKVHL